MTSSPPATEQAGLESPTAETQFRNTDLAAASIAAAAATAAAIDFGTDSEQPDPHPNYWDTTCLPRNMLSSRAAAALARLRAYSPPPFPLWDSLPVSRRAAVLVLLYADRGGELRVVLTMRSAHLRSFSGHAAFPGGKADSIEETEFAIARREAFEEIGLPTAENEEKSLPEGFHAEELCCLPFNLAKTELVVRPCVAFLHAPEREAAPKQAHVERQLETRNRSIRSSATKAARQSRGISRTENGGERGSLLPKLDAKEVAAVFSAPFHNFLLAEDEIAPGREKERLPPGIWYEGTWTYWHEDPWRAHFFYVPITNQKVMKPTATAAAAVNDIATATTAPKTKEGKALSEKQFKPDPLTNVDNPDGSSGAKTLAEGSPAAQQQWRQKDPEDEKQTPQAEHVAESLAHAGRYKVWGMTARILVDAATIAFNERPSFEHNAHLGDEMIIDGLYRMGRLADKTKKQQSHKISFHTEEKRGEGLTGDDLRRAREVAENAAAHASESTIRLPGSGKEKGLRERGRI